MVRQRPSFVADSYPGMPVVRRYEATRWAFHVLPCPVVRRIRLSVAAISSSDQRVAISLTIFSASLGARLVCSPVAGFRTRSSECCPPRQWMRSTTSRVASCTSTTISSMSARTSAVSFAGRWSRRSTPLRGLWQARRESRDRERATCPLARQPPSLRIHAACSARHSTEFPIRRRRGGSPDRPHGIGGRRASPRTQPAVAPTRKPDVARRSAGRHHARPRAQPSIASGCTARRISLAIAESGRCAPKLIQGSRPCIAWPRRQL